MDTRTASPTLRHSVARLRRRLAGSVVGLGVCAGLVACGPDDARSDLPAAVCDAVVRFDAAIARAPRDPAGMRTFAESSLLPQLETLVIRLAGEEQYAAETIYSALLEVIDTGDPSPLMASDTAAARARIGEAVHHGCDMTAMTVIAREHSFDGALQELRPGRASFALWNEGVEEHEMVVFRAAPGVTEPLDEILQLPEAEMVRRIEPVAVAFGGPGTKRYTTVDLEPGTYFLVCFLPVGGAAGGPPHHSAGMQHTFTVA